MLHTDDGLPFGSLILIACTALSVCAAAEHRQPCFWSGFCGARAQREKGTRGQGSRAQSLEAAYDAELLSLLRSHVIPKIPEMKAKLLADAADRRFAFATAEVDMPLDDLLHAHKHAELYEVVGSIADTSVTDPKERQFRRIRWWLSHRPALEEFNAEVAKEFKGATEINTYVDNFFTCIRVRVSIKFGQ